MGHHNRQFYDDASSLHGAWSPPTSRANFCEEDYAVSRYLAEFINSLTNLAYVYYALRFMYSSQRPGPRGLFSPRVDYMSVSLLVLGISSFLFHASMRATLEFADELSMIGLCWSFLQGTLTARQSPARCRAITFALTVALSAFCVFYIWSAKIIYHVIAFTGMLIFVAIRGQWLFHFADPPFPEAKRRDWSMRTWKAILVSVLGYVLWWIDLEYCMEMRSLRESVGGAPWAWLLEFHGWWHILTAVGAAKVMDVIREVGEELKNEKSE